MNQNNQSRFKPSSILALVFSVSLCLCGSSSLLSAAEKPPNVVLIVIDDLGQRDLGCYGSGFYKTPHIDQMAKDGVRFTDFYAACPVCSPTRVSIMTGRYPQRANITDWIPGRKDQPDQRLKRPEIRNELPLEEVTIAEALKARGYATALMGKWHLGGKGFEPQKQGFDVNIGGDHTGTPLSYFAPFVNKAGAQMPGLEKAPDGEYLTDRLATEAESLIAKHKDKPFFLYLPHYGVHTPLRAPQATIDKYKVTPRAGSQSNPVYAAMVEHMDAAVGRVLKALDDNKLSENTLVIFTSDNGGLATTEGGPTGATFNGPLREGKGFLYEGGVRVACVMKWPGHIKPGTVTKDVANSNDLFDTILAAAERSREPQASENRDGRSLLPIFEGGKMKERPVFWHYPHYANQGSRPGGAVRKGDFKLIEYYEDGRRELFDVAKDISESRNLAADKPDAVKELAAELDAWRKEVGAKMPTKNPDYKPNPPNKDGVITMHAKSALVYGTQLRFEPLPHKNTLGFWTNKNDFATFDFTAEKGEYTVEVLQGCGKGSGGAKVVMAVGQPGGPPGGTEVDFLVKDTGGFQNFEAREVGKLKIEKAGRYVLYVQAETKPGVAVMDLRQVTLKPIK